MKLSPLFLVSFAQAALAGTFSVSDSYEGEDFINDWEFQSFTDPNHGTVYVARLSPHWHLCSSQLLQQLRRQINRHFSGPRIRLGQQLHSESRRHKRCQLQRAREKLGQTGIASYL